MDSSKKPPDKYTVVKIPLSQICTKHLDYNVLYDAADRTNKLVIHVYQFLELWILDKYKKKKSIPPLNDKIICLVFKALSVDSAAGKQPKGISSQYYSEFKDFYEKN